MKQVKAPEENTDISFSSTSLYAQRTWFKYTILNQIGLFNPPSDEGNLFSEDCGSESAHYTHSVPICVYIRRLSSEARCTAHA